MNERGITEKGLLSKFYNTKMLTAASLASSAALPSPSWGIRVCLQFNKLHPNTSQVPGQFIDGPLVKSPDIAGSHV